MTIARCICKDNPEGTTLNWHDVRFHALEQAQGCGYSAEVIRRIQLDDRASMCQRWNTCGGTIPAFVQTYVDETVT